MISIDQCIRHPGSVHEQSGKTAQILDFSADVTPVAHLLALGPKPGSQPPSQHGRSHNSVPHMPSGAWLQAAEKLGDWHEREMDCMEVFTHANHLVYIRDMPAQGWSDPFYRSRSEVEMAIVATLVRAGASDRQIIEFADHHLAKHIEKSEREGRRYVQRMINAARERLYENFNLLNHPLGGWPRKRNADHRWTSGKSYEAALELVQGQQVSEWIKQMQAAGIATQRTAYRIRDRLLEYDLIAIDEHRCVRQT